MVRGDDPGRLIMGPGAKTLAVANLFSAGAVYHRGAAHPLKMHACFQELICGLRRLALYSPSREELKGVSAPLAGTQCCSGALLWSVAVPDVMSFNGAEDGVKLPRVNFQVYLPLFSILDFHLPHNLTLGFVCGSHRQGQER